MILQEIIWPKAGICYEEKMYIHTNVLDEMFDADLIENRTKINTNFFNRDKITIMLDGGVTLNKKSKISFDTYFNSFSYSKWKKYTEVKKVKLNLLLKGHCNIFLCKKIWVDNKVYKTVLSVDEVKLEEEQNVSFDFGEPEEGMIYFEVSAIEDTTIYGGYYEDTTIEEAKYDVSIGINICTYKRERYIKNNISILNELIINNENSPLYKKLHVFISDNGKTLPINELTSDYIHIVKNKNVGGAGGFTRGLIEILKDDNKYKITHVLMMDDDVTIEPNSIIKTERILSILKDEYADSFVGGAMLRIDEPNIQVESGASWNAGELISNKTRLNMNVDWDCLFNEIEEYTEFNAWWYCCMPMSLINENNLPLPLFIRGDDLEYGLRNMNNLILMNGICVWHEPFENKYSSFLNYYIIRNRLIDNALHCPDWGKKELKRYIKQTFDYEAKLYRYKNIELMCNGIEDFLKGPDFLKDTDAEKLHKDIMNKGYKFQPIEKLDYKFLYKKYENDKKVGTKGIKDIIRRITFNGVILPANRTRILSVCFAQPRMTVRTKKILYYDPNSHKGFVCEKNGKLLLSEIRRVRRLYKLIDKKYIDVVNNYRMNVNKLMTETFWKNYLEI